jgi:hypothetical protein
MGIENSREKTDLIFWKELAAQQVNSYKGVPMGSKTPVP